MGIHRLFFVDVIKDFVRWGEMDSRGRISRGDEGNEEFQEYL